MLYWKSRVQVHPLVLVLCGIVLFCVNRMCENGELACVYSAPCAWLSTHRMHTWYYWGLVSVEHSLNKANWWISHFLQGFLYSMWSWLVLNKIWTHTACYVIWWDCILALRNLHLPSTAGSYACMHVHTCAGIHVRPHVHPCVLYVRSTMCTFLLC